MNTTTKHSEAPWSVVDGFVVAKDGAYVADPHLQGGPEDHAERDANGALMAIAPDLLALVERMAHVPAGDALAYYTEVGNDARLLLARRV